MSNGKKISVKKALRSAMNLALVVLFLVCLIAASHDQHTKPAEGFIIHLNDENEFSFLQKQDIKKWLLNNEILDIENTPISQLNLKQIEAIAETNPWVAKAEIYVDNRRILHIDILQREPLARIFDKESNSYYMDNTLHFMPVSKGYTYPTTVFTNVPVYKADSLNGVMKTKIAYLSEVISNDSFWNAQITQIEVQADQTFIASPLLGDQKIIIGDTNRIQEKLNNLLAFYKNVSSKVGWNTYEVYDLRFKGQIVTSPSIGKTPPRITVPEIIDPMAQPQSTANISNPKPRQQERATITDIKKEDKPPDKTEKTEQEKKDNNKPKYIYQKAT